MCPHWRRVPRSLFDAYMNYTLSEGGREPGTRGCGHVAIRYSIRVLFIRGGGGGGYRGAWAGIGGAETIMYHGETSHPTTSTGLNYCL